MTEEINNKEQAKHQGGFWIGLAVGLVMLIGLITFSGCSNNGASNASPSQSLDKIYKVDELVGVALGNKDAWKDKEVTVTGYAQNVSGSRIGLLNDPDSKSQNLVRCEIPEADVPQGGLTPLVMSKTVEVKGKIKKIATDVFSDKTELKYVELDPCALKK